MKNDNKFQLCARRELIPLQSVSRRFLIPYLTILFSTIIILTSCNTSTQESIQERNKELVKEMNKEVWNKYNLDIMNQMFTPDFVLHFLPDGSEIKGIDNLRKHVQEHREAFPDWREEIRHIVAERNLVVIHYVSTGTNQGRWLGKSPTGRKIQINEVSIFRIESGKIAEQWLLPDIFSMEQQLAGTENK